MLKKANLPKPIFKTKGMFTVVFHRTVEETVEKTVEETVEETVTIILKAMKENPKITAKALQEKTGLSRRGVEYNLDKLKKDKVIIRVGSTKGGYWEIQKKS